MRRAPSRRIRARGELTRLPCLTVGDRSADAARAAGFTRVESADGALADLVRLATRHAGGRLLYLAGEDRAGDLAGELSGHGIAVETAVVYRAVALEKLPAEIAQARARRRPALLTPQRRDLAASRRSGRRA